MRCLSLWEPWASLLVHGLKRIETRGDHMAKLKAGPLLIHSAKRWFGDQLAACRLPEFAAALRTIGVDYDIPARHRSEHAKSSRNFPFGKVIGSVNVLGVCGTDRVAFNENQDRFISMPDATKLIVGRWEKAFSDYSPGRVAIITNEATVFPQPFEFKGQQGMFDVPDELVSAARKVPEPAVPDSVCAECGHKIGRLTPGQTVQCECCHSITW